MNETGTHCASKHSLDQILVETELKKGMKLKWAGMDQDGSERTQRKYWDWRKRQQNLQTQQHILIQNSKSCSLHIPLLSAHLGGTQSNLHPLVCRTFFLKVQSHDTSCLWKLPLQKTLQPLLVSGSIILCDGQCTHEAKTLTIKKWLYFFKMHWI